MAGSCRLAAWIIIVGLVARLAYVLAYPQQPVSLDAAGYDDAAITWVNTGEYPSIARGPLYPAFLAATYWAFGHSYPAVRVVQAVVVSVIAVFVFLVGHALFDERRGAVAAAIVSLYPGFFAYSGLLLTETVFGLLLAVFAWCFVGAWQGGRLWWAAAAGLMIGLATLCRGEVSGLAVPGAMLLIWRFPRWPGLRAAGALVVVTLLALAPWAARQQLRQEVNVVLPSAVGATLWLSTYPGEWLEWKVDQEPLRSLLDCDCTPSELNQILIRESLRNVRESPAQYAWMSVKRVGRFWIGSHTGAVRGLESSFQAAMASREYGVLAVKGVMMALNLALVAAAVLGLYTQRASWQAWLPLVLIIGYVNLVHVFLFSTSRYQIPIIPMVAVLAACARDRVAIRFPSSELA